MKTFGPFNLFKLGSMKAQPTSEESVLNNLPDFLNNLPNCEIQIRQMAIFLMGNGFSDEERNLVIDYLTRDLRDNGPHVYACANLYLDLITKKHYSENFIRALAHINDVKWAHHVAETRWAALVAEKEAALAAKVADEAAVIAANAANVAKQAAAKADEVAAIVALSPVEEFPNLPFLPILLILGGLLFSFLSGRRK